MKRSEAVKNARTERTHGGLVERYLGVLAAPRRTLGEVARAPHWAGMLALVVALVTIPAFAFLSTERGETAALDTLVARLENLGIAVDDTLYGRLLAGLPSFRWIAAASSIAGLPLLAAGLALALHTGFRAAGHRSTRFVQVFAIVVHSAVVISVQRLAALPINYLSESIAMPTSLGALVPMLEETTLVARFLGGIDLFTVWWLMVLALGLAALYPPPARRIAAGLIGGYAAVALAMAIAVSALRIS